MAPAIHYTSVESTLPIRSCVCFVRHFVQHYDLDIGGANQDQANGGRQAATPITARRSFVRALTGKPVALPRPSTTPRTPSDPPCQRGGARREPIHTDLVSRPNHASDDRRRMQTLDAPRPRTSSAEPLFCHAGHRCQHWHSIPRSANTERTKRVHPTSAGRCLRTYAP